MRESLEHSEKEDKTNISRKKNLRSKPVLQNPSQPREKPSVLPINHF